MKVILTKKPYFYHYYLPYTVPIEFQCTKSFQKSICKKGTMLPSLHGFQNPSLLGFQILLCLDFKSFFAWISNPSLLGF
jgi:hypothetical protein